MPNYTRDAILVWAFVLIAAGLVAFIVVETGGDENKAVPSTPATPAVQTTPSPAAGAATVNIKMIPTIRFDVDEITFKTPPPGEYFFRCDVHQTQMVGRLLIQ